MFNKFRWLKMYQVWQKSNPLIFFCCFLINCLELKFYTFMWLSYLHLNAKWNLIIFKYNKVIDIFVWPLSDFRVLKNVCAKTQQNSVTETTQWTLRLMYDSHFVCSNCLPPAFVHLFSHSVMLWTTCGNQLSQISCKASWVLDGARDRPPTSPPDMIVHNN